MACSGPVWETPGGQPWKGKLSDGIIITIIIKPGKAVIVSTGDPEN